MNEWANDKEIYWCIVGNIYGLIVVKFYALRTQGHHHKIAAGEHLRYLRLTDTWQCCDNLGLVRVTGVISGKYASSEPGTQCRV